MLLSFPPSSAELIFSYFFSSEFWGNLPHRPSDHSYKNLKPGRSGREGTVGGRR